MATEMPASFRTIADGRTIKASSPDAADPPAAPPPRMPLTNPLAALLWQTMNAVAEA